MRLYFLFAFLLVVVHHTHAGLLAEMRGILSTATRQAARLSKLAKRFNNQRHQGNETVILDVTLDSLTETIAYLTAENEQLRATNAELRTMSRKQKQWLSIVRRELSVRLDDAAKNHVVDKEELRKRLEHEHQQEIATIKQEMKQQLEKIDAETKHQQIQQTQQIAEMKLASSKSLAEVKRELREKETAINSLTEKTAAVTEKLKREQQANDELIKELTKHKQAKGEVTKEVANKVANKDASSIANEKVGIRSNSVKKNVPIDIEPSPPIATEKETKASGGSSAFPPKPKTVNKSSRSRNPKPRSSSKGSK